MPRRRRSRSPPTTCVHRLRSCPRTISKAVGPRRLATRRRAEYIVEQLQDLGFGPGGPDGRWQQSFNVVGITAAMPKQWTFSKGGKKASLQVVGPVHRRQRRADRAGRRSRTPRSCSSATASRRPSTMGRLQGHGPEGQGPADAEQRSGLGSEAVRRQDAPLLRPLDLQVRERRAPGRRGRDHHPHHAVGRLSVARSCRRPGAASSSSCRPRASRASR